ncbi:hypothetical protein [Xanthomonas sp. 1678]|uniref:hypothetical protein n=1 Tax=Xanthomonas sp. 1678 TaxID=3158788 RepID=UPI00286214B2|nr:hypothetical protein [Xanthomonas translucens]
MNGTQRDQLARRTRSTPWDALFFVVPVAPTTLASCYVLGDVQQRGGLDHFRQLREALPVRRIDSTAASAP